MRYFSFLLFLLTSCATLSEMKETMEHASVVIEQNTEKLEQAGIIIEKNTYETKFYTRIMRYAFPIVWASIFALNYIFFKKILNRIGRRRL
jgi:predicted transcriptional regulator